MSRGHDRAPYRTAKQRPAGYAFQPIFRQVKRVVIQPTPTIPTNRKQAKVMVKATCYRLSKLLKVHAQTIGSSFDLMGMIDRMDFENGHKRRAARQLARKLERLCSMTLA